MLKITTSIPANREPPTVSWVSTPTARLHQPPVIAAIAVDELAEVKAAIAKLQEREKALVAALKATGMERIIGTLHEAVISLSERETVDVKAMPAELKAPYLRVTLVETLKLTARKTS